MNLNKIPGTLAYGSSKVPHAHIQKKDFQGYTCTLRKSEKLTLGLALT